MLKKINKLKEKAFSIKLIPILIIIISVLGFLAGLYFYLGQLFSTPLYFWIFVIDCPLYVILFSVIVAMRMGGRTNSLLNNIVSVGLIKYGLWTILVTILNNGSIFMFALPHSLMVLGGFLLMFFSKTKFKGFLLVLSWFLLNDFMDYIVGIVGFIPRAYVDFVTYFSLFTTVFFVSLVYVVNRFVTNQSK
ncbi:MAG: DUF1405 domain-containing protein [Nanoarchaeota archaeon]